MRTIVLLAICGILVGCPEDAPDPAPVDVHERDEDCVNCHLEDFRGSPFDHASVGFGLACEECHTVTEWDPTQLPDHDDDFLLDGAHAAAACGACHTADRDDPQPDRCVDCHAADRTNAERDHDEFGSSDECAICHTTSVWSPATFDDHDEFFPLEGAHAPPDGPECADCHTDDQFEGTPRECAVCHDGVYQEAPFDHRSVDYGPPDHPDCEECHTANDWEPTQIPMHDEFPLVGGHDEPCSACHTQGVVYMQPAECIDCHRDDQDLANLEVDGHGVVPPGCEDCHTVTDPWTPSSFQHDALFALTGAHAVAPPDGPACSDCHQDDLLADPPRVCIDCHREDREALDPPHPMTSDDCTECHLTTGWEGAGTEHLVFPLEGAHAVPPPDGPLCTDCHTIQFEGTAQECAVCHDAAYRAALFDHDSVGYAPPDPSCDDCHTANDWSPSPVPRHPNDFRLDGGHDHQPCSACHTVGVMYGEPPQCLDCHQDDQMRANREDPGHQVMPPECEACHTISTPWARSSFDHNAAFALDGAHAAPPPNGPSCTDCHQDNLIADPARRCLNCHVEDRDAHPAAHRQFDNTDNCSGCHSTANWEAGDFDHDRIFPLQGAHAPPNGPACDQCHLENRPVTPRACAGCHADDQNRANAAVDGHARFSADCEECHTVARWGGAAFDHGRFFPLANAHAAPDCDACHIEGQQTPTECLGCHADDRDRNPAAHRQLGETDDCADCHSTINWEGVDFDHNRNFRLQGAHAPPDGPECGECHLENRPVTPRTCVGCHVADQNRANAGVDGHARFSDDCTDCHRQRRWGGAVFDHNQFFPLDNGHARPECGDCHIEGRDATPTECLGCHAQDRDRHPAAHRQLGNTDDCTGCHSTVNWEGAEFDHDRVFPIVGIHTVLACDRCHLPDRPVTPRECVGCHSAVRDMHPVAHRPFGNTDNCVECHSIDAINFESGVFDHAIYPLVNGHANEACNQCHGDNHEVANPTRECAPCHPFARARADRNHREHGRFPDDCAACHQPGTWDGVVFDHGVFPLEGGHAWAPCDECHGNGRGVVDPPRACMACHAGAQANANNNLRNHGNFPNDCTLCHPITRWQDGHLDHPDFPQQHAPCAECHIQAGNYDAWSCIDGRCHLQADTDREHGGVEGYSWSNRSPMNGLQGCIECHPNGVPE